MPKFLCDDDVKELYVSLVNAEIAEARGDGLTVPNALEVVRECRTALVQVAAALCDLDAWDANPSNPAWEADVNMLAEMAAVFAITCDTAAVRMRAAGMACDESSA